MIRKVSLIVLMLFFIIFSFGNTMLLIYPMWIITYLIKENLKKLLSKLPLVIAFVGSGFVFGILTEIFAIFNNLSKPAEQRILLSPNPIYDLIFASVYYLLIIIMWYILLSKMKYSKTEVFILTGLFGILTEEVGQVFLRIFTVPMYGLFYAIIVMFVYGIFPMLAYMLTEKRFKSQKAGIVKKYVVTAFAFFIFFAVYGLLILPVMKTIFH